MRSQDKKWGQPLEARKGKEFDSPLERRTLSSGEKEHSPANTLPLLRGDPFRIPALQNCKVVNMCFLKPLNCDSWLQQQ